MSTGAEADVSLTCGVVSQKGVSAAKVKHRVDSNIKSCKTSSPGGDLSRMAMSGTATMDGMHACTNRTESETGWSMTSRKRIFSVGNGSTCLSCARRVATPNG